MNKEDYSKYYIQGSDHYLIPKDVFDELFDEMVNWKEEAKELKMKDKLEPNMYVRTKYGISQYKCYDTSNGKLLCIPVKNGSQGVFANIEDILKASHNIIDLIEVGDYVNGHKVLNVEQYQIEVESSAIENETWEEIEFYEIKSIVTKEQFEQMAYKVGE